MNWEDAWHSVVAPVIILLLANVSVVVDEERDSEANRSESSATIDAAAPAEVCAEGKWLLSCRL